MKKYHVTIQFDWNEEMASQLEPHRTYINYLINKNIIEHYAVTMETQRVWITLNAESKEEVTSLLEKSPFYKYWTLEIDELFLLDGQYYRFPQLQPN